MLAMATLQTCVGDSWCTMLGVILSDHIPGDLNLTLTLTANSNSGFSGIKPDTDRIFNRVSPE